MSLFVWVVVIFNKECIREKTGEFVFNILPFVHLPCSEYEFLISKHIGEGLAKEANLKVYSKMSILVLSQLPIELILLLDEHAGHCIVKDHIFSDIFLLVENFNGLLIEFGFDKELLHLLQVAKLNSCKDFPLANFDSIILCLMLEGLNKSK